MTVWHDLLSAALVGTGRRPFDVDRLADVVDPSSLEVGTTEAALLAGAAVVSAWRRAGRQPDHWPGDRPEPAPVDHRRRCSEGAAQLLELLLRGHLSTPGGSHPLIQAWLEACARAGQRPPARLVVPLLELGSARSALQASITPVVGSLGRWLGGQNRAWSWAAPAPVTDFATASRAERAGLLNALRATDPAAGRALIESIWRAEPVAERAALVDSLVTGLSEDDEPFLEAALDDRSGSVRSAAAAALDRLPHSRRGVRMAERAQRLVRVKRRSLQVELPDQLDDSARRDGITDRRAPATGVSATGVSASRMSATSLNSSWLTQIVAATPLSTWALDPADGVRMAADQPPPTGAAVLAGWQQAAVRQRDHRWAQALARHTPSPALLSVLEPVPAGAVLEAAVQGRRMAVPVLVGLLAAVPGPWSTELSGLVVEHLRAREKGSVPGGLISAAGAVLAGRLDSGVTPGIEAWITTFPEGSLIRHQLRELVHALSIRHTIDREFA